MEHNKRLVRPIGLGMILCGAMAIFSGCSAKDCDIYDPTPSPDPNTDTSTKQGGGMIDPNAYFKPLARPEDAMPDALQEFEDQTLRVDDTDYKD